MVRWSDGLYGGLIAGFVSAVFFLLVGSVVDHNPVLGQYFVEYAVGVFGARIESLPILALCFGLFLHFLSAMIFGIIYANFASRFKPAWSAPTSVLCGIVYGLIMLYIAEYVAVPMMRVVSTTAFWEALVGNVIFHGLILSEYITIAHRRNIAAMA